MGHVAPPVQSASVQQVDFEMHELMCAQAECPGGQAHVPPGIGHTSPVTAQSALLQHVLLGMQPPEAMHGFCPASQGRPPPLLLPLPLLEPLFPELLPEPLPDPDPELEPLPELPPEPELLPDPELLLEPLPVQSDP